MAPRGPLTLTLFAELISNYIEREQLLDKLEKANQALLGYSYTDALTDLLFQDRGWSGTLYVDHVGLR